MATANREESCRIAVDATIVRGEQGGIRTFTRGLAGALADAPGIEVVVLARAGDAGNWGGHEIREVGLTSVDPIRRSVWRERELARVLESVAADVVLVPAHELPRRALGVPSIIVVHDVGPLVAPALYGRARWLRYALTLRGAIQRSSATVCVSRATRMDVHATLGVSPGRLTVIGQGHQITHKAHTPDESIDLPFESYALYVGSVLPHKNLQTLVSTFGRGAPHGLHGLVIVGPDYGGDVARLQAQIDEAGAGQRVRHLGFVPPEALRALYASASLVLLPSLHEGFGIPLLEAMATEKPLLVSDIPALREVGEDAVYYVTDPLDPDAWRDGIESALARGSRAVNRAAAARRLSAFRWEDVAARYAALARGLL